MEQEKKKIMENKTEDLLQYEKELYKNKINLIAGVDEVGRGPLYGPVVAAAVILPKNYHLEGLTDSKKLSEKKRNKFYEILKNEAVSIGVGYVTPERIDEINIYNATKEAMVEAINNLSPQPEHILIDAMPLELDIPTTSIIKGDSKSLSIAAASVIAKVTRDKLMYEIDIKHPEYHFKDHKGYPTKAHLEALETYGLFEGYRRTYGPVKRILEKEGEN